MGCSSKASGVNYIACYWVGLPAGSNKQHNTTARVQHKLVLKHHVTAQVTDTCGQMQYPLLPHTTLTAASKRGFKWNKHTQQPHTPANTFTCWLMTAPQYQQNTLPRACPVTMLHRCAIAATEVSSSSQAQCQIWCNQPTLGDPKQQRWQHPRLSAHACNVGCISPHHIQTS